MYALTLNWWTSLFSQDECYQVRQIFAQKLHMALVKLLLPLEYMAVFALCAKDPVKERRAHARQCLLKNISVRREYIKQNPMAQGRDTFVHIHSPVTLMGTTCTPAHVIMLPFLNTAPSTRRFQFVPLISACPLASEWPKRGCFCVFIKL